MTRQTFCSHGPIHGQTTSSAKIELFGIRDGKKITSTYFGGQRLFLAVDLSDLSNLSGHHGA